jgi:hypothetical protein
MSVAASYCKFKSFYKDYWHIHLWDPLNLWFNAFVVLYIRIVTMFPSKTKRPVLILPLETKATDIIEDVFAILCTPRNHNVL